MLSEYIKMARASIKASRFRSFMTMFGIIVGVAGVVTVISLGEGIKYQVSKQSNDVGHDLITVRPGNVVKRDAQGDITGVNVSAFLTANNLTDKDLKTIKDDPGVASIVPFALVNGSVKYGKTSYGNAYVVATSSELPNVIKRKTDYGGFFSDSGDRRAAVIGYNVAEQLFKENIPLGKNFQIRGKDFVVTGILERIPTNPLSPEVDYNDGIFIPYSVAKDIAGTELRPYEVKVRPKDASEQSVNQLATSLSNKIKANHDGQDDVTILTQDELMDVAASVVGTVSKVVSIIAGITLLTGGVGIMNVMLVAVSERTREIGIRKAVGATSHQIRAQFLIESALLSFWGAMIGLFVAVILHLGIRIFTDLEPIVTWQSALVVTIISMATGIIFGIIPAFKASMKHPIESLRRN
jgi:putative ABC transport system permease protein